MVGKVELAMAAKLEEASVVWMSEIEAVEVVATAVAQAASKIVVMAGALTAAEEAVAMLVSSLPASMVVGRASALMETGNVADLTSVMVTKAAAYPSAKLMVRVEVAPSEVLTMAAVAAVREAEMAVAWETAAVTAVA